MSGRSTAATWALGWCLFALALVGLRYCGLIGLAWRWVAFFTVLLPVALLIVFVVACVFYAGALSVWDWLERRCECERARRVISQTYWENRAAREQAEKEAAKHGR